MSTHETIDQRQAETPVLLLDPKVLAAHPSNVRQNLRDLRGMVRSIKAVGVLVPLVVIPTEDGGHQIVAGHRRCAAAIEAGLATVPCLVRADLDDAKQVAAMLVENTQREGLSGAEEAAGYEQLAVLGLSDSSIAKATGATRRHVERARKVAASDVASAVAGRYELTLEQALVIAEFEDDHKAVKNLVATATKNPGQFDHLASRLRQDRDRDARRAATVEALVTSGVTVLSEADRYDNHPRSASLRDLVNGDGTPLTPESHAGCPGHFAVVQQWEPTEASYYCLDPTKHGHRSRYGRGRPKGTMTEQEKAERRQVVESNKAWKAADPVRRRYIQRLLSAKKVPAGTLRYAVGEIVTESDRIGDADEALLAELTGVKGPGSYGRHIGPRYLAGLSDARLPLALLAQVAADNEDAMGVHTWRQRSPRAARWLSFLASTGYTLSAVEQHVVDQAQPHIGTEANPGPEPAGEPEPVNDDEPESMGEPPEHAGGRIISIRAPDLTADRAVRSGESVDAEPSGGEDTGDVTGVDAS